MEPYIFCLISTFVPEHFKILTFMAGGKLMKEERDGCTYANGVLHSFDDKPAEIRSDRDQLWYKNGKIHRDNDLPAAIFVSGEYQMWYKNGKVHRDGDLPAVIWADGIQVWCKNGRKY
jgi:antitoxin component YwqK of YwqJK toxin-antitoxin module